MSLQELSPVGEDVEVEATWNQAPTAEKLAEFVKRRLAAPALATIELDV